MLVTSGVESINDIFCYQELSIDGGKRIISSVVNCVFDDIFVFGYIFHYIL
jgi:hypothetical protein